MLVDGKDHCRHRMYRIVGVALDVKHHCRCSCGCIGLWASLWMYGIVGVAVYVKRHYECSCGCKASL